MDFLLKTDKYILYFLNTSFSSESLDGFMLVLSGPIPWVLLFAYILVMSWLKLKKTGFWKVVLLFSAAIAFSDLLAYRVLKPAFARKRPCVEYMDLRLVDGCGGSFGFPSNHATNGACGIVLYFLLFRSRKQFFPLLVFVFLIGFSRIYLGAHYPLDVIAGFGLGAFVAYVLYILGMRALKLQVAESTIHGWRRR